MGSFRNPSRDNIDAFLRGIRTIAVVGLSDNAARPSHGVARALQSFGYRIVPVNPAIAAALGERAWRDLGSAAAGIGASTRIDVVNVFRAPEFLAPIVDDCIRLSLPALWLQDGVVDHAQALRAAGAGIFTVMDRCLYRDRAMLAAG